MSQFKKCFQVKKRDFSRAGEASIRIKSLLKSMNLDPELVRRVAICGYEGEMNIVMHGGDGTLCAEINTDSIKLELYDDGPGISDIELAMTAGYSTASDEHRRMGFGAGMGLPNMKKNADRLFIQSEKGNGTRVQMFFSINPKGG